MNERSGKVKSTEWTRLLFCGLLSGAIINAIEWVAHRVWLDDRWNAAFAALGRTPSFWSTFVAANFAVGIVAMWSYRWLSSVYRPGLPTALKIATAMWIIFWIVPIAGLQPFRIFPDYLLALVVAVGLVDVALGMLPVFRLFERARSH